MYEALGECVCMCVRAFVCVYAYVCVGRVHTHYQSGTVRTMKAVKH